jgi:ABC-2 type transport system ATP-binding protein
METCDLARTARRKIIGTLSKGFRQRVGIADALLGNPEVIIMDEPTIGLDPHQIQGIRKLIDNLRGRLTVVLSSHILPEIERSCDRVIIINRGRIVASGTSDSLRQEFLPGNRFELQVAGSERSVTEALKAKGFEVEILQSETREDNTLNLTLRVEGNGELGPQLIAALNDAANCTLRSLAPRVPNLEEIFLAATKRSWEETIDSSKAKPVAIAKS